MLEVILRSDLSRISKIPLKVNNVGRNAKPWPFWPLILYPLHPKIMQGTGHEIVPLLVPP